MLQYRVAASYIECALCTGARAYDLYLVVGAQIGCTKMLTCCSGRACAAHFDLINPLDKQVISSECDPAFPPRCAGRPVCPFFAVPRFNTVKGTKTHHVGVEVV